MRRLDLYIFRELLGPTLLGVLLFLTVLLTKQFFQLAELAIRDRLSSGVILQLLGCILPALLVLTIPMAVLLGVLIGIGRMSADSEIVALRASGISPVRMLRPVGLLAVLGFLASSAVYHFLVPVASTAYVRLLLESAQNSRLAARIEPRIFHEQFPGIVLYADEVTPEGLLKGVFLWREDFEGGGRMPGLFLARTADIDVDPGTGGLRIQMHEGSQHQVANDIPRSYQTTVFRENDLRPDPRMTGVFLSRGFDVSSSSRDPRAQSVPELLRNIRELATPEAASSLKPETIQKRRASSWVELHKRFSLPFACLVLALVALPLGVANRRGGSASGFALAIGVIVVYYILITWTENKAVIEGAFSPHWSTWLANAVFLLAGIALFTRHLRSLDLGLPSVTAWLRARLGPVRAALARPLRRGGPPAVSSPVEPHAGPPSPSPRPPFPRLLDLYVGRVYLRTFLTIVAGLFVVTLLVHYFADLSRWVLRNDIPLATVIEFFRFATPDFLAEMLPVAAMIAVLVGMGLLQRSNEVTALRVCGISLYRAFLPILLVGLVLGVLSWMLQSRVTPYTNRRAGEIEDRIKGRPTTHSQGGRRWLMGDGRRIYHYLYFDDRQERIIALEVYEISPDFQLLSRTYASQAALGPGGWVLDWGWVRTFGPDGRETGYRAFDKEPAPWMPSDTRVFTRESRTPKEMGYAELRAYIRSLARSGYSTRGLEYDLYDKVARPANVLVLILMGLPFSLLLGKRGALYGVGLALSLSLVYFAVLALFAALGHAELVNPLLAALGPGLLFGSLSAFLILNIRT